MSNGTATPDEASGSSQNGCPLCTNAALDICFCEGACTHPACVGWVGPTPQA